MHFQRACDIDSKHSHPPTLAGTQTHDCTSTRGTTNNNFHTNVITNAPASLVYVLDLDNANLTEGDGHPRGNLLAFLPGKPHLLDPWNSTFLHVCRGPLTKDTELNSGRDIFSFHTRLYFYKKLKIIGIASSKIQTFYSFFLKPSPRYYFIIIIGHIMPTSSNIEVTLWSICSVKKKIKDIVLFDKQ